MIKRELYLKKIRPFKDDTDLIKVITGIRRCGKSTIMSQLKEEIELMTNNVLYIDLEERKTKREIYDSRTLYDYIDKKRSNNEKWYIFIDEIQTIDGWADVCNSLRRENISLFITGSNSKLLSSEFTKELSGRYVAFRVRPFVYKEALQYAKELNKDYSVTDYLIWGGFPKSLEYDGEDKINYLNDIYETIIYNDLLNRYKIRKEHLFKEICDYVFKSNSRIISFKSITNYIKSNNLSCSINTVSNYVEYIYEAFGIDLLKEYSTKAKKELAYCYKTYNADVSFNSLNANNNKYDLDHNLENVVYNELLYMGYEVKFYRIDNDEIDFYVFKNGRAHYIQVAYSVVDEKAYQREFKAFNKMDNSVEKILITNDEIDFSTSTVRHIKLKDFLMMESL